MDGGPSFWQQIAKLYDNDLKAIYQPNTDKEDQLIEHILKKSNKKKVVVKLTSQTERKPSCF